MSRTGHRITKERCFLCDQERLCIRFTNTFRACLECLDWYRADLAAAQETESANAEPMGAWE